MKCSRCSRWAVAEVGWKGRAYCSDHYREYFLGQVRKVMDKFRVGGKVCVAVSGGKDSAACLEALTHFRGIELEAFFLDLGIPRFSRGSLKKVSELCEELGVDLTVVSLKERWGKSIPEILKERKGKACSLCGTVKRYVMNAYSYEGRFDFLATGHTLSDVVSSTLNNLANVYVQAFRGVGPFLEAKEEFKLSRKIKPLYYLTDEECKLYSELLELPFYTGKCPYVSDAPTKRIKAWLNRLERDQPGVLRNFAKSFTLLESSMENRGEILKCKRCGYATTTRICKFCRLMN